MIITCQVPSRGISRQICVLLWQTGRCRITSLAGLCRQKHNTESLFCREQLVPDLE